MTGLFTIAYNAIVLTVFEYLDCVRTADGAAPQRRHPSPCTPQTLPRLAPVRGGLSDDPAGLRLVRKHPNVNCDDSEYKVGWKPRERLSHQSAAQRNLGPAFALLFVATVVVPLFYFVQITRGQAANKLRNPHFVRKVSSHAATVTQRPPPRMVGLTGFATTVRLARSSAH